MVGNGGSPLASFRRSQRTGRRLLSELPFSTTSSAAARYSTAVNTLYVETRRLVNGRNASKGGLLGAPRRDPGAAQAALGLPLTRTRWLPRSTGSRGRCSV